MKTIELNAELREAVGKQATKAVRREGRIPAILYGRGIDPTPLVVTQKDLHQATHTKAGANALISLKIGGPKAKKDTTCLIKDVQRDPISDRVDHVDFVAISLTEKIKIKVPVVVKDTADAIGVKDGGVLDLIHHEIEVECLPTKIPERFEVSIKELKIGDAIHLKEIKLPPDVTPLLETEEVVVTIHPPMKEEVAPPPTEGAVEPEVIEKGKKEEAAEGAPEAAPAAEKPGAEKPKAEKAEKPQKP